MRSKLNIPKSQRPLKKNQRVDMLLHSMVFNTNVGNYYLQHPRLSFLISDIHIHIMSITCFSFTKRGIL